MTTTAGVKAKTTTKYWYFFYNEINKNNNTDNKNNSSNNNYYYFYLHKITISAPETKTPTTATSTKASTTMTIGAATSWVSTFFFIASFKLLLACICVKILHCVSFWEQANSCEPRHDKTNKVSVRPAKTKISLGIRPVWSVSSLSAWRKRGSLATHWAQAKTLIRLGGCPGWSESDLVAHSFCWFCHAVAHVIKAFNSTSCFGSPVKYW